MNKPKTISQALAFAFGAGVVVTSLLVLGMVAYGITRKQSVDFPWIATYLDTPREISFQLTAYAPLVILAIAAILVVPFYFMLRNRTSDNG